MRSRKITVWVMVMVLGGCTSKAVALIELKDGQIHNITSEFNDDVRVDYQTPGMKTTVNILGGGGTGLSHSLTVYEDGFVNIFNESMVGYVCAVGRSQVSIFGGCIGLGGVVAMNSSQVNISGGWINSGVSGIGGQVNISGGSICNPGWLEVYGTCRTYLSGGSIYSDLNLNSDGILTIYGSDFAVNSQPVGYGELTSLLGGWYNMEPCRRLTGMLASGHQIDNDFYIGENAKIVLVPEPATLLLLGLGAVMIRRKR
ncbi:MAG: PEP-CTERM sorting domain-containing protein [Sedimentisphaerales bacterium]